MPIATSESPATDAILNHARPKSRPLFFPASLARNINGVREGQVDSEQVADFLPSSRNGVLHDDPQVDSEQVADFLPPKPQTEPSADTLPMASASESEGLTDIRQFEPRATPVVRFDRINATQRRYEILQQWEGVVDNADENILSATIHDLTVPSMPMEVVEIPIREFPEADRDLLRTGSVFYWSIGYDKTDGGQLRRVSEIRVRRLPKWTHLDLESARYAGEKLLERLINGESKEPA